MELRVIARIQSDFPTKFGVPRQSGLADETLARVVFEPPYRSADALRGLEGFSHLWLIWQFSHSLREEWSPTVRPPKLGGNRRVGVFATRSPFRPNPLGLSCVRLAAVEDAPGLGRTLLVRGADLVDGTPIYDIKPYLPYADSYPDAACGFAPKPVPALEVDFPNELLCLIPAEKRAGLLQALAQDPRPGYQHEPERVYGMPFSGMDVRFTVACGVLRVREVVPLA